MELLRQISQVIALLPTDQLERALCEQTRNLLGTIDRIGKFQLELECIPVIALMRRFEEALTSPCLDYAGTLTAAQLQHLEISLLAMISQNRFLLFGFVLSQNRQQFVEIGLFIPMR